MLWLNHLKKQNTTKKQKNRKTSKGKGVTRKIIKQTQLTSLPTRKWNCNMSCLRRLFFIMILFPITVICILHLCFCKTISFLNLSSKKSHVILHIYSKLLVQVQILDYGTLRASLVSKICLHIDRGKMAPFLMAPSIELDLALSRTLLFEKSHSWMFTWRVIWHSILRRRFDWYILIQFYSQPHWFRL